MNKMTKLTVGIMLMAISVWVGGYFVHVLPNDSWAIIPTIITSLFVFVFGLEMSLRHDDKPVP